MKGATDPLVNC